MDSKEAIELIKSDVAHLVKTIQQQDKMLELACDSGARLGCPMFEHDPCPEMTTEVTCSECWRKYLQGEVSK